MLLRRFGICLAPRVRQFSALYLTGDKAREEYASVQPYLDFDGILGDRKVLQENVSRRKSPVNLQQVYSQWEQFQRLQEHKDSLELKRMEIARTLKETKGLKEQEIENLKLQGKAIRNTLKELKENSYEFEEEFINNFLQIPNKIQTGVKKEVLWTHLSKEASSQEGDTQDSSPYARGDLARIEFAFPNFCQKFFKDKEYEYFSNPDFVRSVIVEAAGVDKGSLFQVLEEEGNKINQLHLAGGGSMLSFMSFIARLSLLPTQLPLAFVANGKIYHSEEKSQGNCVQVFSASRTAEEAAEKFYEILEGIKEIYARLGEHFRVMSISPEDLESSEMMKASLQLHSSQEDYLEVASVSLHGDYISKRLLFNFKDGKEFKFPHIVTASVINTCNLKRLLSGKPASNLSKILQICNT